MITVTRVAFLFLFSFLLSPSLSINLPALPGPSITVFTRQLAQIPPFQGRPAKIVCIQPFFRDLIVCTLHALYRVSPTGQVSLFLNVQAAFSSRPTSGNLNIANTIHGGVRSFALHPNFGSNRRFYISAMANRPANPNNFRYVGPPSPTAGVDSVVAEFTVGSNNLPIISSYRTVLRIAIPRYENPIKQILFSGPFLFIAHGDGRDSINPFLGGEGNNALGKILRINPLRSGSVPYTIPPDNPFQNGGRFPRETWAVGFRNPLGLSIGPGGVLICADSGRDNIEEVNIVRRGSNYGWARREGSFIQLQNGGRCTGIAQLPSNDGVNGFEYPVAQFQKASQGFHAIAGGYVVANGSPMSGNYYYADFPQSGTLHFSNFQAMRGAITRGPPGSLRRAPTRTARIAFIGRSGTTIFNSLGAVIRADPAFRGARRADIRFGRGSRGELYWSSKTNGRLYVFTSSIPRR